MRISEGVVVRVVITPHFIHSFVRRLANRVQKIVACASDGYDGEKRAWPSVGTCPPSYRSGSVPQDRCSSRGLYHSKTDKHSAQHKIRVHHRRRNNNNTASAYILTYSGPPIRTSQKWQTANSKSFATHWIRFRRTSSPHPAHRHSIRKIRESGMSDGAKTALINIQAIVCVCVCVWRRGSWKVRVLVCVFVCFSVKDANNNNNNTRGLTCNLFVSI